MERQTRVRERPIIFNAKMIHAIRNGRKTQTRRPLKPQPMDGITLLGPEIFTPAVIDRTGEIVPGAPHYGVYDDVGEQGWKCPFGQPGDRLWVRETWAVDGNGVVVYRASPNWKPLDCPPVDRWRPSIHMPRWASRLTLEIKSIRVERLHEISESDVLAEGVKRARFITDKLMGNGPVLSFKSDWNSIYHNWKTNPWVWVIEFERAER